MILKYIQEQLYADITLEQEIVFAYRPIVQALLSFATLHFLILTIDHAITKDGLEAMAAIAVSLASAFTVLTTSQTIKRTNSMMKLEVASLIGNGLILLNLLPFFLIEFDPSHLMYFIMMVFIFAITSPTRQIAALSCFVTLGAFYYSIWTNDPGLVQAYVYAGIISSLAAMAASILVRRVLVESLDAKILAADKQREAIEAADQATKLAITDELTSLPNRRDFFAILEARTKSSNDKGTYLAVFLIDLDGFKPINDTYGHAIGDELIVSASSRLATLLPPQAYLARVGGDEFGVLLNVASEEQAHDLGKSICLDMRKPFSLQQVSVHIGVTIGITTNTSGRMPPSELMEQADFALYAAKRDQKGQCTMFTEEDARIMKRRVVIEQTLRGCDMDKELEVVFQPQIDARTNNVVGFEALARWHSPELGEVPPRVFIRVAERSGLITRVTRVLLRKALSEAAKWPEDLVLSFNLSVYDVLDTPTIESIMGTVRRFGIPPSRVCFELTETVMMSDMDAARQSLHRLSNAGHKVALDDFGTGYSCFSYLYQLPIDTIKIDRSFLNALSTHSSSTHVLSALLQLARSLRKNCVIEGVESETHLAIVKVMGAQTVQGFYFGEPLPAHKVHTYLKHRNEVTQNDGVFLA